MGAPSAEALGLFWGTALVRAVKGDGTVMAAEQVNFAVEESYMIDCQSLTFHLFGTCPDDK